MSDLWGRAPGEGLQPSRSTLRKVVGSLLVGAMSLGVAWAGAGLVPVNGTEVIDGATQEVSTLPSKEGVVTEGDTQALSQLDLSSGQILAGASKVSLRPRPEDYQTDYPGARWETNKAACATFEPAFDDIQQTATHVADFRVRWAENPDCLYMGGYGLGPMNPIVGWDDQYGLWSRSVAMSDGTDSVILTLIDAVYWEAYYNSMCPTPESTGVTERCGFLQLAEDLAAETGLKPESFIFASTHSHTSMDFIGGWGGVPEWYMQQATDSLRASVRQALASMQPAVLETGETLARQYNGERRDFYRSAEDETLSWFRLVDADDQPTPEVCTTPSPVPDEPGNNGNGGGNGFGNEGKEEPAPAPTPVCEPPAPGKAIATVGAFAAHPVTADESAGIADADFPAVFAKKVEENFGGVGMFLQAGLGNVSPRGNKVEMGTGLASLIPAIGAGTQVTNADVRVGRTYWDHPVTNVPLGSLGVAGFFDRKFNQTPAEVREGKSGAHNKKCTSASPVSVNTSVSAAKIGSLWITGGPGETFSNLSNTVKERNPNGVTMALGLVNDGLGYIVQSFETDHVGRQGVGFVGGTSTEFHDDQPAETEQEVGFSEYEDAYSIDHCFGDAVLEKTIRLLGAI